MKFLIRNSLNKFDFMTPQDLSWISHSAEAISDDNEGPEDGGKTSF